MNAAPSTLDPVALSRVAAGYPELGAFGGVVKNGLSINTAACLFETTTGVYFAKRYDPSERDAEAILAEHALIARLLSEGYATPRLLSTAEGATMRWDEGQPYAVFEKARGEDRYAAAPVFSPCNDPEETRALGAALAAFHLALASHPPVAPRPLRGMTARYRLMAAPSVRHGLAALYEEAPVLAPFLAERPAFEACLPWIEDWHRRTRPHLARIPRGIIHGDLIKRNVFWQGTAVADVIDFDLWNEEVWVFDLALSLIPAGFAWPEILEGRAEPDARHLRALLEGYQAVRPLEAFERAVLPWVVATARVEFYLSLVARALGSGDRIEAERFFGLMVDTLGWFHSHPRWHDVLA